MTERSDETVVATVRGYILGSEHPDIQVYRRDLGDDWSSDAWLGRIKSFCNWGGFERKQLLEVGAGFGWDAVGMALIGNNRIVALDVLPSMIDGMQQCLRAMEQKGEPLPIEPLCADICNSGLPDGAFEGIYSSEAIEHVHSLETMFDECWRLLRPGGRLVLFNDSNQYNTEFRENTFRMWRERDTSWEHAQWLEREIRPVEHKGTKPYAAMREEMVRAEMPDISDDDVQQVVAATAGLTRPDIVSAAKTYASSKTLPTPPRFSWCRNPETGEYAERLLDPFELRDMLRARGFDAKLHHVFRKFPFSMLNDVDFRPVNEWIFDRRAQFAVVAEKPLKGR